MTAIVFSLICFSLCFSFDFHENECNSIIFHVLISSDGCLCALYFRGESHGDTTKVSTKNGTLSLQDEKKVHLTKAKNFTTRNFFSLIFRANFFIFFGRN